jgi:hypothetical protein
VPAAKNGLGLASYKRALEALQVLDHHSVPEFVGKEAASILPDVPVRTWDSIVFRLEALLLALRATA